MGVTVVTIEQAKALLGPDYTPTDHEVEQLLAQLVGLSVFVIEAVASSTLDGSPVCERIRA